MPRIMHTGATPKNSRSPTPSATSRLGTSTTNIAPQPSEQKMLIVSNNSVGGTPSSEVALDKDRLLSPVRSYLTCLVS